MARIKRKPRKNGDELFLVVYLSVLHLTVKGFIMQTEKLVSLLKSMEYDGAVEPTDWLSDKPDFWVEHILLEIYETLFTALNEFNKAAIAELKAQGQRTPTLACAAPQVSSTPARAKSVSLNLRS